MSITVDTAAPSKDLTTLPNVKGVLGLDMSEDAYILQRIRRISSAIERHCRRVFARETVTETLPGNGRTLLLLSRTPIVSISSLTIDGDAQTAPDDYSIRDREVGSLFREKGWPSSEYDRGSFTPQGSNQFKESISVTYVGGYVLPSFADVDDPVTLPPEIEDAAIEIFKTWDAGRTRDPNLLSERIGDWAATYGSSTRINAGGGINAIPATAMELLLPYVRQA